MIQRPSSSNRRAVLTILAGLALLPIVILLTWGLYLLEKAGLPVHIKGNLGLGAAEILFGLPLAVILIIRGLWMMLDKTHKSITIKAKR